jgi:hypothetical protein
MYGKFLLLAATASVLATASAQTVAPKTAVGGTAAIRSRISHTCKDPNQGAVFREADGGYHESAQGWFIRAEVHQGSGWAFAYCYYGLDKAAPANRPVYSVHYEMTGFKSNQCSVSGKIVTCVRAAALLQKN